MVVIFWLRSGITANEPWYLQNPKSQPETIDLSIASMIDILLITLTLTAILYWRTCQTDHQQQGSLHKLDFSIILAVLALPIVAPSPAPPSPHSYSVEDQAISSFMTISVFYIVSLVFHYTV